MSESHTLKYVHVDTLNRKPGDTKSRMTIQVNQGLDNCSRVALKSFSIPNTFPNMIGTKIQWIEMIQTVDGGNPIWKSALFTIFMNDLDTNQTYLDNVNLQFELQTRFQNEGAVTIYKIDISRDGLVFNDVEERNHKVASEVEMPITIVYDNDSYKFKIYGIQNSATKHKIMILYDDESGNSLWHYMGFHQNKLMTKEKFPEFLSQAYESLETPTTAVEHNTYINPFLKSFYAKDMRDAADNTIKVKSIYGEQPSRHENHIGKINLCSDLASDSFIMGDGTLRNTDILETIHNNVPKYSYIHHSADTLYFHNLNISHVHKFDLRLYEGDDMNQLVDEQLPNWSAVLVFEQNLEIEYHKEDTNKMNEFAYTLGHPTR